MATRDYSRQRDKINNGGAGPHRSSTLNAAYIRPPQPVPHPWCPAPDISFYGFPQPVSVISLPLGHVACCCILVILLCVCMHVHNPQHQRSCWHAAPGRFRGNDHAGRIVASCQYPRLDHLEIRLHPLRLDS